MNFIVNSRGTKVSYDFSKGFSGILRGRGSRILLVIVQMSPSETHSRIPSWTRPSEIFLEIPLAVFPDIGTEIRPVIS